MSEALDEIQSQIGAENTADSCSRDGCDVSLADVPLERIIVDVDLAFPAHGWKGERCDFIIFLMKEDGTLLAAPLELKSGGIELTKAHRQLRRGAEFIDHFGPTSRSLTCRPILIHGRSLSRKEFKRLNRLKVEFRGLPLTIQTERCGRSRNLARVLAI